MPDRFLLPSLPLVAILLLSPLSCFGQEAVTVTVAPSAVTFTYQIGDAKLPAAVSVQVKAGKGTLPITVDPLPAGSEWLIVTQSAGTTPATLSLLANPSGKVAGTYRVAVTVNATGASNTPQTVNVTLIVKSPPPSLSVSAASVPFTYTTGDLVGPADRTLSIASTGAAVSLTLSAPNANWLKLNKTVGFAAAGAPFVVTLSIDGTVLGNLTPKLYSTVLTIKPGDATVKSVTVPVTLEVSAGAPAITSVYPDSVPMGAANVTISIFGRNFQSSSVVSIGANQLLPQGVTFVSKTALLAVVPASVLAVSADYAVTVSNGTLASPLPGKLTVQASSANITAVANAASFEHESETVSPGEIIAIFGSGLGPVDLVVNAPIGSPTAYPTRAAKTEVEIETAAGVFTKLPLILAQDSQINAIIPIGATTGVGRRLRVYADVIGAPLLYDEVTLDIVAATPGVFTFDASGQGQAAVLNLNSDGTLSLNTAKTPAAASGTVVIYLTGAGTLSAPIADGAIVPESSTATTSLPATVEVNGLACTVVYSGVSPTSVQGLVQLNATLPSGVTGTVPLVVKYGGASSQPGVTITIK